MYIPSQVPQQVPPTMPPPNSVGYPPRVGYGAPTSTYPPQSNPPPVPQQPQSVYTYLYYFVWTALILFLWPCTFTCCFFPADMPPKCIQTHLFISLQPLPHHTWPPPLFPSCSSLLSRSPFPWRCVEYKSCTCMWILFKWVKNNEPYSEMFKYLIKSSQSFTALSEG